MNPTLSRRLVIGGSAAIPALALSATACAETAAAPDAAEKVRATLKDATGTKLVILGSGGGPVPGGTRHMTSHLMLSNGDAYVLDCGLGVTDQFARTGVRFAQLKAIFITHHHPDHNIEYGPLLVIGWVRGMPPSVHAYGPPPLSQMTRDFLNAYKTTIDFWAEDFKRAPLTAVDVGEVGTAGPVMRDANVAVSSVLVNHPPVTPALGYRFDFKDRSIAFSGDTTPLGAVARMAKGADVLVHEAMAVPEIEDYVRGSITSGSRPGAFETIMAHMRADHSPVEEVGRIAAEAGVKTLVLSHLAPGIDSIADDVWRERAAKSFKGEIIVAHDMTVV
jgi:ribonuclease BN (tRNA processing enzyme)